jgi:hypothetical protein
MTNATRKESEQFAATVGSLAAITDHSPHAMVDTPEMLINAIELCFPASVVTTSFDAPNDRSSEDRRFALIPRTTIVIKTTPLVWNAVKAILKIFAAVQLQAIGQTAGAVLTGGSAIESISKARKCVESLDADAGEYCTYLTVLRSVDPFTRQIGLYPTKTAARAAHLDYQRTCARSTCKHHVAGVCAVTDANRDVIVSDLQRRGVLVSQPGDCIWVAV